MPVSENDSAHAAIRLRATVSHLTRQLRALSSRDGPGAAKLGVLGQLYRLGPLTPTRLAQSERVKLQTLTRLLAELEAEKLIKRRPHQHDARQTLLSLTAAGVRVLTDEIHNRETSLAAVIARCLSSSDCARLLASCGLIDRLADALAEDSGESVHADHPHANPVQVDRRSVAP
jgi:DNA-binding MarR family transcriptional regulator